MYAEHENSRDTAIILSGEERRGSEEKEMRKKGKRERLFLIEPCVSKTQKTLFESSYLTIPFFIHLTRFPTIRMTSPTGRLILGSRLSQHHTCLPSSLLESCS